MLPVLHIALSIFVSVICAVQPYKHWKAVESWNVVKKVK